MPNPFWHGEKPFVVCSSMPDAFQIPGISVVEQLAQMQEYIWTLQNHRLDSVRMQNNLITLIRSDVDDPDAYDFYPGAQWFVEDPGQVTTLPVDPNRGADHARGRGDDQGRPAEHHGRAPVRRVGQRADQTTATGMSIITSIAQRMIKARKQTTPGPTRRSASTSSR